MKPEIIEIEIPQKMDDIEKLVIRATLKRYKGNRVRTSLATGMSPRTLGRRVRRWDSEDLQKFMKETK